ncbi:hypothetical protein HK101_004750 [Irineochytrium annulatum]|nr:hypothetical protein HK101_004750 [Irineochytrium annulatum]
MTIPELKRWMRSKDDFHFLAWRTTNETEHSLDTHCAHSHISITNVIYDTQSFADRRALHEKAAEMYEGMLAKDGIRDILLPLITHHYMRSANVVKSLQYLEELGTFYMANFVVPRWISTYQTLIDLAAIHTSHFTPDHLALLHAYCGEGHCQNMSFDAAHENMVTALDLLGIGWPADSKAAQKEVLKAVGLHLRFVRGNEGRKLIAIKLSDKASFRRLVNAAIKTSLTDPDDWAEACIIVACVLQWIGAVSLARYYVKKAEVFLHKSEKSANAWIYYGVVLCEDLQQEEARANLMRAVSVAQKTGNQNAECYWMRGQMTLYPNMERIADETAKSEDITPFMSYISLFKFGAMTDDEKAMQSMMAKMDVILNRASENKGDTWYYTCALLMCQVWWLQRNKADVSETLPKYVQFWQLLSNWKTGQASIEEALAIGAMNAWSFIERYNVSCEKASTNRGKVSNESFQVLSREQIAAFKLVIKNIATSTKKYSFASRQGMIRVSWYLFDAANTHLTQSTPKSVEKLRRLLEKGEVAKLGGDVLVLSLFMRSIIAVYTTQETERQQMLRSVGEDCQRTGIKWRFGCLP